MTNSQKANIYRYAKNRKEKLESLLSRAKFGAKIQNKDWFNNIGDISDFMRIYNYLNDFNFVDAWEEIAGLDTEPRDRILPSKFYNLLQQEYEK